MKHKHILIYIDSFVHALYIFIPEEDFCKQVLDYPLLGSEKVIKNKPKVKLL